jgi:lipoprotein-anchoring transpeptidase ErfK/SrfK
LAASLPFTRVHDHHEGTIMELTTGKSKAQNHRALWLVLVMVLTPLVSAHGQHPEATTQAFGNARRRLVLVSLADRKLAVLENGKLIRTFPVSVGAPDSPSPVGEFQIVNRVANPAYYHPGVMIAPGSDSPIGPRWVGLSRKGYGIHGTNEASSIGKARSHGCIRLRNGDIKQFFAMVRVGDTVEIRGQSDEQTVQIFGGGDTHRLALDRAPVLAMTGAASGQ